MAELRADHATLKATRWAGFAGYDGWFARANNAALGVQAALEWAFQVEKAQLELPVRRDINQEGFGFGLEYVLIQRARLGCKVDGGGRSSQSYTHQDAEVVAATLAGMPDSRGGKRMAIYVAELARAGMTPDWLPGVVPR